MRLSAFLLERWGDARLLEKTMKGVRTKYKMLFDRIIEAVRESHPELDAHRALPTQPWSEGQIGFGRKSWPSDRYGSPSGLWVQCVLLEMLTADESDPPCAYIWVPSNAKLDFGAARAVVNEAAKELLSPEEFQGTTKPDEDEVLRYLPAPSKGELLRALSEGDGQRFVQLFVSQFDMMARFVPVLDKVFQEHLNK